MSQEPRIDLLILILAGLLLAAMALTLIFGSERSRHGYGIQQPTDGPGKVQQITAQGPPLRIGSPC